MHMVESRYPLSKLGDVLAAFKPDLVLVAVRVDAVPRGPPRGRLVRDDVRGEPRQAARRLGRADRLVPRAGPRRRRRARRAVGRGGDRAEGGRRSSAAAALHVRAGERRRARRRRCSSRPAPRRAIAPAIRWPRAVTHGSSTSPRAPSSRHGRPKRVLAYVDVLDRPAVDLAARTASATRRRSPRDRHRKAKEEMIGDIPPDVMGDVEGRSSSARAPRSTSAKTAPRRRSGATGSARCRSPSTSARPAA